MRAILKSIGLMFILPVAMICLDAPSEGADIPVWSNLGIYGGQVATIAIDPSNPDRIFAGTYLGDGLYLSENGGESWRPVEKETFQNTVVFDAAFAPSDPRTLWVVHNYWVERSKDGGRSWTHFQNSAIQRDCPTCGGEPDDFRFCQAVAVDPADPETAYVGTGGPSGAYDNGAVYGTSDGGESWTKLQEFDYAVVDMAIDPANGDVIWIVTSSFGYGGWDGTLYRSGDGGETWETIFSLAPFQTAFQSIAVVPGTSDSVFTGCGRGLIQHWFDGETWQITFPVIEGSTLIRDIVFAPSDPNVVYIPWVDYFSLAPMLSISKDGGFTWETQPLAEDRFNGILAVAVHPEKANVAYAGDEALGLLASDDFGTTWTPRNNGINATIVYDVDVDPSDQSHLVAGAILIRGTEADISQHTLLASAIFHF